MALRRPATKSQAWLFQDFLFSSEGSEEFRYVQVKWDGEVYNVLSETFDSEGTGGSILAQIDYSKVGNLITVENWWVNWRDEWPLRQGLNYLRNCLYPSFQGYVIRVNDEALAFWVSEEFEPIGDNFLYRL